MCVCVYVFFVFSFRRRQEIWEADEGAGAADMMATRVELAFVVDVGNLVAEGGMAGGHERARCETRVLGRAV